MKIKTLGFWKDIATWGGFLIAVCGAFYALCLGKLDLVSGSITFGGLGINAIGNFIGVAQANRQKANAERAENRIAEAEAKIRELEPKMRCKGFLDHFLVSFGKNNFRIEEG